MEVSMHSLRTVLVAVALLLAPATLGAALAADTTPTGMVAFFMVDTERCPTGWRVPDLARGRIFVGTGAGTGVGVTANEAMRDGQPPRHKHDVKLTFDLKSKSIAATAGDNEQGAHSGKRSFDASTAEAESGWAFTQLVACEKE
jgi:hypothetical protein